MLHIEVSRSGQYTLITLNGRIDSMNADEVNAALGEEIDKGNIHIALDLGDVHHLSGSGVHVLVTALQRIKAVDGDLCIQRASENVRSVLNISDMEDIHDCENDG